MSHAVVGDISGDRVHGSVNGAKGVVAHRAAALRIAWDKRGGDTEN
eukprot:gene34218-19254_t